MEVDSFFKKILSETLWLSVGFVVGILGFFAGAKLQKYRHEHGINGLMLLFICPFGAIASGVSAFILLLLEVTTETRLISMIGVNILIFLIIVKSLN